jgi:hypothetical protein
MTTALVIPSNRPALLAEFLKAWTPVKDWDDTIIVFDGPQAPKIEGADGCRQAADGLRLPSGLPVPSPPSLFLALPVIGATAMFSLGDETKAATTSKAESPNSKTRTGHKSKADLWPVQHSAVASPVGHVRMKKPRQNGPAGRVEIQVLV